MTLDTDTIKKLVDMGATAVEVKPDGSIVARFDKPQAPQFVPMPYPYPVQPLYPPTLPWPHTIWWGSADNQIAASPFAQTWLTTDVPNG